MTQIKFLNDGRLPLWTLAAFSAFSISTFSTGYGIYVSLTQTTGAPPSVTLVAAGAISIFISMLGYIAWSQFGASLLASRFFNAPLMLFLGLSIAMASVTFSAGGMIFWTQKEALQKVLTAKATIQITSPIFQLVDQLTQIQTASNRLSEYAMKRSEIETRQGGTCGGTPIVGEGPITRLRINHSREAATQTKIATSIKADALAISRSISPSSSQKSISNAFAQARLLLNDGRIAGIKFWVSDLAKQLQRESFLWEGRERFCRDLFMLSAASGLIDVLEQPVELPKSVPVAASPDLFQAMSTGINELLTMAANEDEVDRNIAISVIPVLFIALMIDLVGLISAAMVGARPAPLNDQELSYHHRLRWHLNALRWDSGDNSYFIVPLNGNPDLGIEANNLAATYDLRRIPGMTGITFNEIAELNSMEAERLSAVSGGATRFTGYSFNDDLHSTWKQVERILSFSKRNYSYSQPPGSPPSPPNLTPIDGGLANVK